MEGSEDQPLVVPATATAVAVPVGTVQPSAPPIAYAEEEPKPQPAAATVPEQLVEVAAPATLPEGYGFDAVFGGRTFKAIVPAGGVVKGQRFTVTFQPDASTPCNDANAPHGRWKDGLCDCCSLGCCHPSLLNAWLCPQIMAAQIMTRMKLNWRAMPAEGEAWRRTFRTVVWILVGFIVTSSVLRPYVKPRYETAEDGTLTSLGPVGPTSLVVLNKVLKFLFGLYTLILIARTRIAIRRAYGIPVQNCGACEDACCSFWCGCCTLAQMARHTADYNVGREKCCSCGRAKCCSATGLKKEVAYHHSSLVV